jgi:hypothetical protein
MGRDEGSSLQFFVALSEYIADRAIWSIEAARRKQMFNSVQFFVKIPRPLLGASMTSWAHAAQCSGGGYLLPSFGAATKTLPSRPY